jgi:hypothetical protein
VLQKTPYPKDFIQVVVQNVYEGKTSLKYTDHNQLTESDSIKHIGSADVDNGNRQSLRGGQDDQSVAFVAQPAMQHKDASLDLLSCHCPFLFTLAQLTPQLSHKKYIDVL